MNPLEILLAGPYNLLYAGGFALAFAVAAIHGRRNGWPMLPWLTLLAACVAGGIAGSKLLHFDLHVAEAGEKTILGGLTGGMLALLLAQRFLRFRGSTAPVLAPAVLLGFAMGRVGCFLAGCCFGIPTTLPWGVRYLEGTAPFRAQVAAGLVGAAEAASLPVHPTQLYEGALAVLLAIGLWRWGSRLRSPGAAGLAMAAGYGIIRFLTEFLRAGGEAQLTHGLKPVQWTVLAAVLGVLAALIWRERRANAPAAPVAAGLERSLWLTFGLLGSALLGGVWFTPLEQTVIAASLLPALALVIRIGVQVSPGRAASGMTVATLAVVPLAFDTIPTYPRSHFTIGASGMAGSYEVIHGDESCGPVEVHEHVYRVAGASLGYTRETSPTHSFSTRLRGFFGTNTRERIQGSPANRDTEIQGLAATATVDTEYLGLTGGLIAGDRISDGEPESGVGLVAGLRAGSLSGFFVTAQYLDHEPSPYPNTQLKFSVGYGFGPHASNVRVGAWEDGIFVGGALVTKQGFEIEPHLGLISGDEARQFGVAVRQRF